METNAVKWRKGPGARECRSAALEAGSARKCILFQSVWKGTWPCLDLDVRPSELKENKVCCSADLVGMEHRWFPESAWKAPLPCCQRSKETMVWEVLPQSCTWLIYKHSPFSENPGQHGNHIRLCLLVL
jgi:hypothetical protein